MFFYSSFLISIKNMVSFYSFLLLCLTSSISGIKVENKYIGYKFMRHFDRKLTCGVFKTVTTSPIDCQELCADTIYCFSVNTYKTSGKDTCELVVKSIKSSNNSCVVNEPGTTNHELSVRVVHYCKLRYRIP